MSVAPQWLVGSRLWGGGGTAASSFPLSRQVAAKGAEGEAARGLRSCFAEQPPEPASRAPAPSPNLR